jgi:hypothetical protein
VGEERQACSTTSAVQTNEDFQNPLSPQLFSSFTATSPTMYADPFTPNRLFPYPLQLDPHHTTYNSQTTTYPKVCAVSGLQCAALWFSERY